MDTQNIRRSFLNYFKSRGHAIIPSSPVIPHDDATLLFTNAGMNQFKDVFLGKTERDYNKAASSQKCVRAGGKHNDLDNVGHTKRHLTFFEMLGNFSFGDYFKEEAIRFAWEVSTQVFELEPEKIFPTVYKDDAEAFEIWKKYVPEKRICRFGEKQNFWAMGEAGPCGPCSELLYDRGPEFGSARNPLEDIAEERYLEFWNLVFMQYNRSPDGTMVPLPKPSIDTGAGLERVAQLKMGVDTVYDTDVLKKLIQQVEILSGIPYRPQEANAAAFRVIADHIRCLSFAIADGAQPSNIERGYVLRKILRRAVRYGKSIGFEKPFLAKILPPLLEMMGDDYIELEKSRERIEEILTAEEESFFRTLKRGGDILSQIVEDAQKNKRKILGQEAFKLKDTYGLPLEEILLLARDSNLQVDVKTYETLEQEAKERSRKMQTKQMEGAATSLFTDWAATHPEPTFTGYTKSMDEAHAAGLVHEGKFVQQLEAGQLGMVILDKTPFYAEKGGQIGDTGHLAGESAWFSVTDTKNPYKGVIAHIGKLDKGPLRVGDRLEAIVDVERRKKISGNHTATHLLHFALGAVLGEHIRQAGSVVAPDRLRFDFSHHKSLSDEQVEEIEMLVNEKIRENHPVAVYEISYEEAQDKQEIKQFFGDKYGSHVRVVDIDFSKELCGGIHVERTGSIGLFRITKEGSIAQGVRRIEAATGKEAEAFSKQAEKTLQALAQSLKTKAPLVAQRIEQLVEENKELGAEVKEFKQKESRTLVDTLLKKLETVNDIPFLAAELALGPEELKLVADTLIEKIGSGVILLGSKQDGRCQLLARVTQDYIAKGIRADHLIKQISPLIEGGGGGKADTAQAGGKNPDKLQEALQAARTLLP